MLERLRSTARVFVRSQLQVRPPDLRPTRSSLFALAVSALLVAGATGLVDLFQDRLQVENASIVYLLAVVAAAMLFGGWMAIGTSIGAFLVYDFFFVKPLYTFSIAAPEAWLDLLLFLVVAIALGRLTALQRARAREAEFRTAEARSMFALSRDMASAPALEAAPAFAARLAERAEMRRVWLALGTNVAEERAVADTAPGEPRPSVASRWLLRAPSAESQPDWMRVRDSQRAGHVPAIHPPRGREHDDDCIVFRVPAEAGHELVGSIWAVRRRGDPFPGRSHTRLLAAAADQFAQAVVRDRLAGEATAAEVARQGDALKSALLDSVSHDLRTPLAAIRASAGNLIDPQVEPPPERVHEFALAIDREAERLSRLVGNMLDLSRIQAGALNPSIQLYELADLVEPVVDRMRPTLEASRLQVNVPHDLPVRVDAQFVDQIVTNLIENAARYSPGRDVRIHARPAGALVELVVEDGGPGVPRSALPRLFDRFYRLGARDRRSDVADPREGMGVGLAVVRGLTMAMGGSVEARPSELGGLAIAVFLPAVAVELSEHAVQRQLADRQVSEPASGEQALAEESTPERRPAERDVADSPDAQRSTAAAGGGRAGRARR